MLRKHDLPDAFTLHEQIVKTVREKLYGGIANSPDAEIQTKLNLLIIRCVGDKLSELIAKNPRINVKAEHELISQYFTNAILALSLGCGNCCEYMSLTLTELLKSGGKTKIEIISSENKENTYDNHTFILANRNDSNELDKSMKLSGATLIDSYNSRVIYFSDKKPPITLHQLTTLDNPVITKSYKISMPLHGYDWFAIMGLIENVRTLMERIDIASLIENRPSKFLGSFRGINLDYDYIKLTILKQFDQEIKVLEHLSEPDILTEDTQLIRILKSSGLDFMGVVDPLGHVDALANIQTEEELKIAKSIHAALKSGFFVGSNPVDQQFVLPHINLPASNKEGTSLGESIQEHFRECKK